jgi:hypothetical protein
MLECSSLVGIFKPSLMFVGKVSSGAPEKGFTQESFNIAGKRYTKLGMRSRENTSFL